MNTRRWRTLVVSREVLLQALTSQGLTVPADAELLDVRKPFGTGNFEFVVASAEYAPLLEGETPPPDWMR